MSVLTLGLWRLLQRYPPELVNYTIILENTGLLWPRLKEY